jgi:O-antigen ligase
VDTLTRTDLIVALALTVLFFGACFFLSPRKTVPILFCLIPFQGIENSQSSLNVLLTYAVAVAFILKGRMNYLPLIGPVLILLGVYIISTAFAHPATQVDHAIYIFNVLSAILLFYVMYNFMRTHGDVDLLVRMLVGMNVLVLAYCAIQLFYGGWNPLGMKELIITNPRMGSEMRLNGPFWAVGILGEYLMLNILIFGYLLTTAHRRHLRFGFSTLIALNFLMLIGTANRGAFLVLLGATLLFLYVFRFTLGIRRTLGILFGGAILVTSATVVIVNFTDMALLFDRLETTEFDGGVPDTRVRVWSAVVPEIQRRPMLGHGPFFYSEGTQPYQGFVSIPYPHNLYLYIVYTLGFVGLFAYLFFFWSLGRRLVAGWRRVSLDDRERLPGLVSLGPIILLAVLLDQMKVEFLRMTLIDYWHFLFAMLAIWVALADKIIFGIEKPATQIQHTPARTYGFS